MELTDNIGGLIDAVRRIDREAVDIRTRIDIEEGKPRIMSYMYYSKKSLEDRIEKLPAIRARVKRLLIFKIVSYVKNI